MIAPPAAAATDSGFAFRRKVGTLLDVKSRLPWIAIVFLLPVSGAEEGETPEPQEPAALEEAAEAEEPGEKAEPVALEQLIADLGDPRFPVRVRATYELWERGDAAGDLLEQIAAGEDPEAALRARDLLRKIQLGILPDSPPEVVRLVVRYDQASASERPDILRALKRLRAWRQVLKIHELERDPETLVLIADEIRGVSVRAARELIGRDEPDLEQARQFLEMGRPEPEQLMSLADFHRATGTLAEELEKAASLRGEAGHLWRYCLHAAAGDLPAAALEARALDMPIILARLRLLQGDPLPWIRTAPVPPGEIPPVSLDAYREAAAGLWEGKTPPARLASALESSVTTALDDESWHSLGVLYALGFTEAADRVFPKVSPSMAYYYFDAHERIDDALAALGIDPAEDELGDQIDADFKAYLDDPDEAEEEAERLFALASFLEARGDEQLLLDHYLAPLEKLGREDPETFINTLGRLFSIYTIVPASSVVIPAAAGYAGDDRGRWTRVLTTLFGDTAMVSETWDSFDAYQADMSPEQRLRLLAALVGTVPDTRIDKESWWQWMRERARAAKRIDQVGAYATMLALSISDTNARLFTELLAEAREAEIDIDELEQEYQLRGLELLYLGALDRWDEVAENWQKLAESRPTDPMTRAYLAGALRRAGREEEAAAADRMADLLALGDPNSMLRIGQAYYSTADFERARLWWHRAAVESVEENDEFRTCCQLLFDEAKVSGDWALAASLGEFFLLTEVMQGDPYKSPVALARGRVEVEIARSLARLDDDRAAAIRTLERWRSPALTDGSMADHFFPALREAGLTRLHDQWFEEAWKQYSAALERYPDSHNTMNTMAWVASRANRRLDEAEKHVRRALELLPEQAAYLDTYGEIWFARGDREKAVEWSDRSLNREPGDENLLRQHDRFERGPFPAK